MKEQNGGMVPKGTQSRPGNQQQTVAVPGRGCLLLGPTELRTSDSQRLRSPMVPKTETVMQR